MILFSTAKKKEEQIKRLRLSLSISIASDCIQFVEYMSANNKESVSIDINKSFHRKSDKKMKFISWYYKFTESVVLNYFKMPSTPYDLVRDDQDLRIPLHAEQAFFHGITFQAKVSSTKKKKIRVNNHFFLICTQNRISLNETTDQTDFASSRLPIIQPGTDRIDGLQFNQWLIL